MSFSRFKMVDYSLPVSKRTRLRREMAELRKKRKKMKNETDSASVNVLCDVSIDRDKDNAPEDSISVNRRMEAGRVVFGVDSEGESDADTFGRECRDSVKCVDSESFGIKDSRGFSTKGNVEVIDLEDEEEGFDSVNSNFSISKSAAAVAKNEDFVCIDLDNEDGSSGLISSCKGKGVLEMSPNKSIGKSHWLNSKGFESGGCSYNTEPACCSDDVVGESDESRASSSEEDYDDLSDGNYEQEESEKSCSKSSSTSESSSSEDGKNNRRHYVETGSRRGRRKGGEIINGGLKRRKAYGLDILVDLDVDGHKSNYSYGNVKIDKQVNCVARRTRSRYRYLSKVKNINSDLGTFSRPLYLDMEGPDFQDDEKELDSSFSHHCGGSWDSDGTTNDEIYQPMSWNSSGEKRTRFNNQSDDILSEKKDVDLLSRIKDEDILSENSSDGFLSEKKDVDENKVESSHERSKPIPRSCCCKKRAQFSNQSDDILLKKKNGDILSRKKDDDFLLGKKDEDTNKVEKSHGKSKRIPCSSSKNRTQFNYQSDDILSKKKDVDFLPEKKYNDILSRKNVDVLSEKKDDDTSKVESSHGRRKLWHSKSFPETNECNSSEDCENIPTVHPKICPEFDDIIKTNDCTLKVLDVSNILIDSIIIDKELPSDELDLPIRRVSQSPLPLKFSFEEPRVPKRSEEEKELDHLWAELDFALRSTEIGATDHNSVENEDVFPSKLEQVDHCPRGNHQLQLHEEIGLICTCCSYVKCEIKDIAPSFATNPSRKSRRKESGSFERVKFDDLQQNFDCDPHDESDTQSHFGRTVWDIIPGIRDGMYPHQREGFEFIWKNVAGGIDLDELREGNSLNSGSGCIVSHAPGTGKTRLTIMFLQTYMELNPTCRPMIIAPSSMLLTWEEEFLKWKVDIPFHNLNKRDLTFKENFPALKFLMEASPSEQSVDNVRLVKILSWQKQKSILGVSYRLFERLAGVKENSKCHKVRNVLLELPDIVVFDEGHIPRNDVSLIWMALSKIKTKRRIILSGTPFQNNFTEFSNTLRLARPNFADVNNFGDGECLDKERGRPKNIPKGKWDLLISSIGRTCDSLPESPELREIRALINPFVHVYRGSILREKLPGLRKSIVILRPAELQKSYLESIVGKNCFELEYAESLISVHPSLKLKCDKELLDADKKMLERVRLNPELGVKIQFLLEIIRLSEALNEKVLVFSQYIEPLFFIEDHLKYHFNWIEGTDLFHMDGKRDIKKRQVLINTFNDPRSQVKVLLASTRACSEGINLVGASRVVLLDVVWNPSVERQAICRAYRLGQKNVVYIYHLITSGTREEDKYSRQMRKDRLSELVFSPEQSNNEKVLSTDLDDKILEAVLQHEKLKNIFQKIAYQSKESSMNGNFGLADQE